MCSDPHACATWGQCCCAPGEASILLLRRLTPLLVVDGGGQIDPFSAALIATLTLLLLRDPRCYETNDCGQRRAGWDCISGVGYWL